MSDTENAVDRVAESIKNILSVLDSELENHGLAFAQEALRTGNAFLAAKSFQRKIDDFRQLKHHATLLYTLWNRVNDEEKEPSTGDGYAGFNDLDTIIIQAAQQNGVELKDIIRNMEIVHVVNVPETVDEPKKTRAKRLAVDKDKKEGVTASELGDLHLNFVDLVKRPWAAKKRVFKYIQTEAGNRGATLPEIVGVIADEFKVEKTDENIETITAYAERFLTYCKRSSYLREIGENFIMGFKGGNYLGTISSMALREAGGEFVK